MHNFNKILDEKRDEIINIASKKERKKMTDDNDKLSFDISTTLHRINAAAEKKYKGSAKYKKETNEQK